MVDAPDVRPWPTAAAAGVATSGAIALAWLVVRHPLADEIAAGITVPWFDEPLRTFGADPLAMVDRAALLVLVLASVVAVMAGRRRRLLRGWLLEDGSPVDLAVVRIVVFGVVAVLPRVRDAVEFSRLPAELRTAPGGMPWLLDLVPARPGIVTPLAIAFVVACLLACIGLWTRPAAITATVLGIHVLGVPQFYGKVTHYHHLWWIMAVLAASRCGDALSVDAVRRAWRRGDGRAAVPPPAAAYGAPVRLVWLLIAITYFFPGAWKWVSAGSQWALSDNVRSIMWEHWSRLDGYTPPLPVDDWPFAYQAAGVGVIVFELAFVVLLFGRRTRAFAAVSGLVFHATNHLFLRLSFATLQVCYVAFVPWDRLFRRIGDRRRPLEIRRASGRSLRLVGGVGAVDVFGVTRFSGVEGPLEVATETGVARGWAAVRLVNRRVVATWPLLALSHAIPRSVGDRWLADPSARHPRATGAPVRPASARAAISVAAVILAANTLAGVGAVTAAWPFASYPTFAGLHTAERIELELIVHRPGEEAEILDAATLRRLVDTENFDSLARPVVREADDALARAHALLEILERTGVGFPTGTTVEIVRATVSLDPDAVDPGDRERLHTIDL